MKWTMTMFFAALMAVMGGFGMVPSDEEIAEALPSVEDLTRDDFAALKAKKKTNAEVGDVLLGYISDDDKPATKFILRQKAFRQYVLGMNFDKADEVYSASRGEGALNMPLAWWTPSGRS